MTDWRTYNDGEHPLELLMAAFARQGVSGPTWHNYGEGAPFRGIEWGRTLIKVSGEPHSIHDRWWDASYLPMVILDPDEVLADPEAVARRLTAAMRTGGELA